MILQSIDHTIVQAATQLGGTGQLRDQIVYVLAEILPYALMLAALVLLFTGKQKRQRERNRETVFLGVAAVLLAVGIRALMAGAIHRIRPYVAFPELHHVNLSILGSQHDSFPAGIYAFPSGHAFMMYTFAGTVFFLGKHPKLSWFLLGISTVVIIFRVVAGVHYASDVVAGAVLGLLLARVVTWQDSWVRRQLR